MATNLQEVFDNTFKAIRESETKQHEKEDYPYHIYARGFVRFNPNAPVGKKNRGSFIAELTTFESTMEFLQSLHWIEMSEEEAKEEEPSSDISIATYWRSTIPENFTGYVGGTQFKNLTKEQQSRVVEVDGAHGPELTVQGDMSDMKRTREIRLITSKPSHKANKTGLHVLATYFPDKLAPSNNGNQEVDKSERFVKIVF